MAERIDLSESPFPGMDPYLENPVTWPDFHDALANEIRIDLQVAASRAYQGGAYLRVIDYLVEPKPPLQAEDAAWADQLLRVVGLR